VIIKAVMENDGDALVFLPGQCEILKIQEILEKNSGVLQSSLCMAHDQYSVSIWLFFHIKEEK